MYIIFQKIFGLSFCRSTRLSALSSANHFRPMLFLSVCLSVCLWDQGEDDMKFVNIDGFKVASADLRPLSTQLFIFHFHAVFT